MGVARMPTQGSWRPGAWTVVGLPLRAIERRGLPARVHAVALVQPFLRDRTRGHAYRRLARRSAPAAAVVAQPVFLPVGVVGVTGPERVGERAVVLAALILVADEKADRRARGLSF